jgi:outer membrane protein assembly factor BamB
VVFFAEGSGAGDDLTREYATALTEFAWLTYDGHHRFPYLFELHPETDKGRSVKKTVSNILLVLLMSICFPEYAHAGDSPQWGERHSRNMVSNETALPVDFDPESGKNIKWSTSIGSHGYAVPVISDGRVLIGANNVDPRDPRHEGDRAVLLCLDEADGSLVWQLVVPRVPGDHHNDWPMIGMCSPPTVEGDRVYVFTNRSEVICLDMKGMANGNDGPYRGEGWHMAPEDEPVMAVSALDADILWIFDLRQQIGMSPHDSPHASILLDGDYLYLNTCNGVNYRHTETRSPDVPALIVLDKTTGQLVAQDNEHFGPRTFHVGWASPSMGVVKGRKLVFFGGPDGICYAFDAVTSSPAFGEVHPLKRVWKFDGDPTAPKENIHDYLNNRKESPSGILGMPVFYKDRIYFTLGGDMWWGKEQSWLKCIDATQNGDISASGELWSYPLEQHTTATPAIADGLVFVTDTGRNLHCVDAETGKPCWTHKLDRDIWSSAFVADGKVYVCTRGGGFWVFEAAREKKLLAHVNLDGSISATPVAANGVLYITTDTRLYAITKP